MNHPYHSNTVGLKAFNNQKISKLKPQSRFLSKNDMDFADQAAEYSLEGGIEPSRTDSPDRASDKVFSSKKIRMGPRQFYDIKGNTFKQTLIPKETAFASLKPREMQDGQYKLNKIKPRFKEEKSGSLLFNTLTQ